MKEMMAEIARMLIVGGRYFSDVAPAFFERWIDLQADPKPEESKISRLYREVRREYLLGWEAYVVSRVIGMTQKTGILPDYKSQLESWLEKASNYELLTISSRFDKEDAIQLTSWILEGEALIQIVS